MNMSTRSKFEWTPGSWFGVSGTKDGVCRLKTKQGVSITMFRQVFQELTDTDFHFSRSGPYHQTKVLEAQHPEVVEALMKEYGDTEGTHTEGNIRVIPAETFSVMRDRKTGEIDILVPSESVCA